MNLLILLWHYFRTRRLHFTHREALELWQARRLPVFRDKVLVKSPWFRRYCAVPFEQWPVMDKAVMMANFDQMNTAGLQRERLMACALQSEQSRDFRPEVGGFSVGLSSGTSGQRGLFVVSPREQQIWAAGILAKALPDGLFAKERVALFLRANNNLYQQVNSRWLTLTFYDLLASFPEQIKQLQQDAPTLIVAPAQVLRALALAVLAGKLTLEVKKVISVAEVLDNQDRQLLEQVFGQVGEIYQATEGFLASTCAHGTLHLNEEFIHVEPQWLDEQRFIPLITDFTRSTQPIVRYRLDDILVARSTPCPCGRVTRAIERIEGRHDDTLMLPDENGGMIPVFADACSRVLAMRLPLTADYRLIQPQPDQLSLLADCDADTLLQCQQALSELFTRQGINVAGLHWSLTVTTWEADFYLKRRRIVREWRKTCAQ
ncbi:MAG: hypothetical protein XXXJIFNMEKO3_03131 [Candidatus Erwinia impunctatus]